MMEALLPLETSGNNLTREVTPQKTWIFTKKLYTY